MKPKSIARSLVRMVKRPFRRRPRIIMTLLCRDEEDIIGYNIAYHLDQGVDFIIATDNGSRDRTPLLLERFERRGKLYLIREPSYTHDQSVWVTRMARMAAKTFEADWVINNDADEFWLSRSGTVRTALEAMPREAECLAVPRFDMMPARAAQAPFFEAMVMRLTSGETVHGYRSPPKACHRAISDVSVADGNHHVNRNGTRMPERTDHSLEIVHYPLRSLAQIERKVRQGAEALEANPRLPPSTTSHWRRLYRDYFLHGRLGEYYDEHAPTAEQVAAGLADGKFAEDTRIRDALRRIDPALAAAD
jgi:hypothetical protein